MKKNLIILALSLLVSIYSFFNFVFSAAVTLIIFGVSSLTFSLTLLYIMGDLIIKLISKWKRRY